MRFETCLARFRAQVVGMDPKDKPALRETWSYYIDALHRAGEIDDVQAQEWCLPENFTPPALPKSGEVWRSNDGTAVHVHVVREGVVHYTILDYAQRIDVYRFMMMFTKDKS